MPKIIFDLPNMEDDGWLQAVQQMEEQEQAEMLEKQHKDRPLPFECKIYDTEPVRVTNEWTGASCMLEPDAVAVYDVVKGSEIIGNWDNVTKGCDWFRKHFPNEFMILLD